MAKAPAGASGLPASVARRFTSPAALALAAAAIALGLVLWNLARPSATDVQLAADRPAVTGSTSPASTAAELGAATRDVMAKLTNRLASLQDRGSAAAAIPDLAATRDQLAKLESAIQALPPASRSAVASAVNAARPALQKAAETAVGATGQESLKTIVDQILLQVDRLARA